ncbi:EEF1A lysine methyltransferase 4 isoform X5 [Cucumis sativus]|uniref:EEF1A lysine methyltransferase 4 isoform X5 n=1 Tax=Cucumis sativus TaxID=3659 RepID=UPI0012F523E3|nr:EEF1A lysine methyltransferase 4 isoform X5 [Cucumis sativus]
MYRDVSSCNTYNYGDAVYWDARYLQEAGSFDWYQRYSSLRPFVLMSEDMVKDGYEDIMNVDISSVAIDMMKRKYQFIPQLKYMEMDVRDMSFFPDEKFGAVIDKGTLDSLMCGTDAPISAAQMLGEVSRLLKPGGVYLLIFRGLQITYGDPKVRMPHLMRPSYNWKIALFIIPRPGYQRPEECSTPEKSNLEQVPLTENGLLSPNFVMEDPDSHFIYVCQKLDDSDPNNIVPPYPLSTDAL